MNKILVMMAIIALVGVSRADVLCKKKSGVLLTRSSCKSKETQVNPATLGLVGPPGVKGDKGDKGDAGPGAQWVLAGSAGSVIAQSGGITVTRISTGTYGVTFGSSVANKALTVTQVCLDSSCPDVGGAQA